MNQLDERILMPMGWAFFAETMVWREMCALRTLQGMAAYTFAAIPGFRICPMQTIMINEKPSGSIVHFMF